jgi:hypothetical protein
MIELRRTDAPYWDRDHRYEWSWYSSAYGAASGFAPTKRLCEARCFVAELEFLEYREAL